MVNDPYQVLGVSPSADEDTIRQAYRRLAKKYHPDLNPGDASAAQKMNEINEAYDLIKNPQAYRQQQQQRQAQQQARQAYQQQQQQGYYDPFDPFGFYNRSSQGGEEQSGQRQYTYYHYTNDDDGTQQQYQWNYRRTRRSPMGFVGKLVAVYFLFQIFFSLLSSCSSFWNPYSYYSSFASGESDSSFSQEAETESSPDSGAFGRDTPSYYFHGFR